MKYLILSIFLLLITTGCSPKAPTKSVSSSEELYFKIKDIRTIPQNIDYFSNTLKLKLSNSRLKSIDSRYNDRFFSAWSLKKISSSLKDLKWPYRVYTKKKMFGSNRKRIFKDWFDTQNINANFKSLNKLSRYAIMVNNSNVRNFPTHAPIYKDHRLAGEGYPFDYNQNTSIKVNTPIFISHLSSDRAWAYTETPFSTGWISVKDIAYVDHNFIEKYKNNNYAVAIKDKFSVLDKNQNFLYYSKLGTIFSIIDENEQELIVYSVKKNIDSNAILESINISKNYISTKPIQLNSTNISNIATELLEETYGWGGKDFQRDCSSTTQDYFAPFGIWLPRNSSAQAKSGKYISFSGLSESEKEDLILKDGIPFLTLIHLSGHIMLYIGEYQNRAIVYHNVWGVKTIIDGKVGRHVIGKTVLTTLEPGIELKGSDIHKTLLHKVKGMVLLLPYEYARNYKQK